MADIETGGFGAKPGGIESLRIDYEYKLLIRLATAKPVSDVLL